jgi:two-component system cell cycle response regulator CtrA
MRRALVVDDDLSISRTLALTLLSLEFESVTADSAREGIACTQQGSFDLVLVDMNMPGLELVKAVTQRDPQLPIIAMSGGSAHQDLEGQALAAGAAAFLLKPFRRQALADAIDTATRRISGTRKEAY